MKVFVAGATGALGTQPVPQLAAAGHDVIGMTRSSAKAEMLGALSARPVVADALDPDAVARAVAETEPEVIVHQLTALKGEPGLRDMRNPDRFGAMTNRLRTEGTDHLLAAGRAVGIRRFIAQSIVSIGTYVRTGGPVKTEEDRPDLDLPAQGRSGADALRYLEEAASATAAAVDNGGPGIYNVVDDEPAPVREWLPFLAEQLGAKKPMRVPRFVVRLLAGEAPVLMMTQMRGASNAKAKRELGWQPRWFTWRVGFAKGLGEGTLGFDEVGQLFGVVAFRPVDEVVAWLLSLA